MSFKADVGRSSDLKKRLDEFKNSFVTEDSLGRLGEEARAVLLKRTAEGKDIEGKAFAPYSGAYKRLREKRAKSPDIVDLRASERMLDDITAEARIEGNSVELCFKSTESLDKAYRHQVEGSGGSGVRRRFFGLNADDTRLLTEFCSAHIEKVIKEKV